MTSTSRVSSRNDPGTDPFRRRNFSPDERGSRWRAARGRRIVRPGARRSRSAARPAGRWRRCRRSTGSTSGWSRRLRDVIEPFARAKPKLADRARRRAQLRRLAGRAGRVRQPQPLRLRPMKGAILVAIDPEFVSRLVDVFYGGSGAVAARRAREFTADRGKPARPPRRSADRARSPRSGRRSCRSSRSCARARPMSASPASARPTSRSCCPASRSRPGPASRP